MVHFKTISRITFFLLLFLFLSSCNKDSKEKIGVKIRAYYAHTNIPIAGLKWKIVEYYSKKKIIDVDLESQNKPTGWVLEGQTNPSLDFQIIEFYPKKKSGYTYRFDLNYSSLEGYAGINYELISVNSGLISREYLSETNTQNLRFLPYLQVSFNWRNINCIDANDKFKYKIVNLDEIPENVIDSYTWIESLSLQGCANIVGSNQTKLGGHYLIKWSATRGGITENGQDTFLLDLNNEILNIEW